MELSHRSRVNFAVVGVFSVLAAAACGNSSSSASHPASPSTPHPASYQASYNAGRNFGAAPATLQFIMADSLTPQAFCAQAITRNYDLAGWMAGCIDAVTGVPIPPSYPVAAQNTPVSGCSQVNQTLNQTAAQPENISLSTFMANLVAVVGANDNAPLPVSGVPSSLAVADREINTGYNLITSILTPTDLQQNLTQADLATIQRTVNGLNEADSLCAPQGTQWTQDLSRIESSLL